MSGVARRHGPGASRRLRGVAVAALALASAAVLAPPALADGKILVCPKKPHEIERVHSSVVWERKGSLWGCAAGYSNPQLGGVESSDPTLSSKRIARRLGPWSAGSRVVFDGVEVVWAYRTTSKAGAPIDRMYAIDVRQGKPWLRGARPTFDTADRTVEQLKLGQNFASWITARGTVMAAAEGGFGGDETPADPFDLDLVGVGTSGATGLVPALLPQGNRLLIGHFPDLTAEGRATLRLSRLTDMNMENEECIGSYRWETTVQPGPGLPRVGGIWRAAYFPSDVNCNPDLER